MFNLNVKKICYIDENHLLSEDASSHILTYCHYGSRCPSCACVDCQRPGSIATLDVDKFLQRTHDVLFVLDVNQC